MMELSMLTIPSCQYQRRKDIPHLPLGSVIVNIEVLRVQHLLCSLLEKFLVFCAFLLLDSLPVVIGVIDCPSVTLVEIWHQILTEKHLSSLAFFLGGGHVVLDAIGPLRAEFSCLDTSQHAHGVHHLEPLRGV